jgi:hypothetical protein
MPFRKGNSTQVRIAAFDGLKWFQPGALKYILSVVCKDSSLVVSRHVASTVCESLAIEFAIAEIRMPAKEPNLILTKVNEALSSERTSRR